MLSLNRRGKEERIIEIFTFLALSFHLEARCNKHTRLKSLRVCEREIILVDRTQAGKESTLHNLG